MRIGFLGIQCDNPNLGVSALAYAGVNLVHEVVQPDAEFVLFSDNTPQGLLRMRTTLGLGERVVRAVPFRHRSPRRLLHSVREIRACDVIVDFTGGDSFSDIYGAKRLAKLLLHKEMAILGGTPLVLAPQTYGPFRRPWLIPWVKHVLRRASLVFARDSQSADYVAGLTTREVILTTDVAVTLPWDGERRTDESPPGGLVGLNVSGLLWGGGYTGDNQFGLKVDYREYCRGVVKALLEAGHRVALVAHVVPTDQYDGEGELAACRELHEEFPETQLAPHFQSPVEAKSWIAGTDVFIGSRMHATIAAFTAGVPTVPAAYSRKFAGLFGSLGYDTLVDLTELDTEEAVAATAGYVSHSHRLQQEVAAGNAEARSRITVFPERLAALLGGLEDFTVSATPG